MWGGQTTSKGCTGSKGVVRVWVWKWAGDEVTAGLHVMYVGRVKDENAGKIFHECVYSTCEVLVFLLLCSLHVGLRFCVSLG